MSSIPEININTSSLDNFICNLRETSYPGITISEISYLDILGNRQKVSSLAELESKLRIYAPINRDKIRISIEIPPAQGTKNKTRAILHLSVEPGDAKIELSGPRRSKEALEDELFNKLRQYKRTLTNNIGKALAAPLAVILILVINFIWPSTIFKESIYTSLSTGVFGFLFTLYFIFRPHCFFNFHLFDHILVIKPDNKMITNHLGNTLISISVFISACFLAFKSPQYLGYDSLMVANSPQLQRHILREAIGTKELNEINGLKIAAQKFDEQMNSPDKEPYVNEMILRLNKIIGKNGFLNKIPIGKISTFLSSASQIQKGNWLQETPLLSIEADPKNGSFIYKPHLVGGMNDHQKFLKKDEWLDEPALKDQYGKIWTRSDLIYDLSEELLADHPTNSSNSIERLRKNPESRIVFEMSDKNLKVVPQNSVEQESIRAISEEVLRSWSIIQNELSANPSK